MSSAVQDLPDSPSATAEAPAEPAPGEAPTEQAPLEEGAFGGGDYIVGTDVQPGTYVSEDNDLCYWQRSSSADGSFESIIANGNVSGRAVVDVVAGDALFSSNGCNDWVPFDATPQISDTISDGDSVVGVHVTPGTYRASPTELCHWQRSSSAAGGFESIIANDTIEPGDQATVEIIDGDAVFTSNGCGEWSRIG